MEEIHFTARKYSSSSGGSPHSFTYGSDRDCYLDSGWNTSGDTPSRPLRTSKTAAEEEGSCQARSDQPFRVRFGLY